MISQKLSWQLRNLEALAYRRAKILYKRCRLKSSKRTRFIKLWNMREDGLGDAEEEELYDLLTSCHLIRYQDEDDAQSYDEYEWDPAILSFIITLHRFAKEYGSITLPNLKNLLNEFLSRTGCRLFEKYGWTPGQAECSTIRPLDEWEPADQWRLKTLYNDDPQGWTV